MSVKARRPYTSARRAAVADRTRRRIVAAARRALAAGKPFSMDAVAAQAKVTRVTVYNQFESRRGLLEAMYDELALEGGLFDLPALFGEPDVHQALRGFVSVFCRFWAMHRPMLVKLGGIARLDSEVGTSLRERAERRRQGVAVLVARLAGGAADRDAIDVLFALTSFEMFEHLSAGKRSPRAIEALLQVLVEAVIAGASKS